MIKTVSTNCKFEYPTRYDGSAPTLPTHSFYFASTTCNIIDSSTTTVIVSNFPTSTASSSNIGYTGPNLNEWLFVVAVFLFFLSWIAWPRISFTKTI